MKIEYSAVEELNPRDRTGIRMLLEHLCGESLNTECQMPGGADRKECGNCQQCMNWAVLSKRLELESLCLEDLNDLLILVDQFPISQGFFETFLSPQKTEISFDELKAGIISFKGFAVLLFGNVRFAYRLMRSLDIESLKEKLEGINRPASEVLEGDFAPRRPALPLPAEINNKSTWLLGYIARNKADRDLTMFAAIAATLGVADEEGFLKNKSDNIRKLFEQLKVRLETTSLWKEIYPDYQALQLTVAGLQEEIRESRRCGWLNTSHYLALDHMDVYVATSMRERWEFEEVHNTAKKIFAASAVANLKLRYFDPTQSFLENRVDKGLVEALMLKRARCTIYMAQETDTFGKDSELATTLAQGKPVIVFVPKVDLEQHAKTAASRPVAYLQRRLPLLIAEERIKSRYVAEVLDFLKKTSSFDPYFQVIGAEEVAFIAENGLTGEKIKMCGILAEAERDLFNSRAKSLQKSHPLALQVKLETGVANGVLVVRSVSECSELLRDLLTNSCSFRFDEEEEENVLALIEATSQCPYRVVTRNTTVSNSFWSRYLSNRDRTKIYN